MAEFSNDYVIKIERGTMGWETYQIIATPESWRKLIADLDMRIDEPPLMANRPFTNESGDIFLLSRHATISQERTGYVALAFYATEDLGSHHRIKTSFKRSLEKVPCAIFLLLFAGLLYLAGVGATKLLHDFITAP